MKNAYAELKALRSAWTAFQQAWPNDADFTSLGFEDINAKHFDEQFERWDEAVSTALAATKPTNQAEDKVLEAAVIRLLREIGQNVEAARSNGVAWLLSKSPFLARTVEAHVAITTLVDRRFRLRKAVINQAMEQVNNQLLEVERAAPIARDIVDLQSTILEQAEGAATSVEAAAASRQQAEQELARVSEALEQVNQAAAAATETRESLDEALTEASKLLTEAKDELKAVSSAKANTEAKIVAGEAQIELATKKLTAALAALNRQGLAGSFEERAKELGSERFWWMFAFGLSIVWLTVVAIYLTLPGLMGLPMISEEPAIWERLLRSIPLLVPGIWLGWLSAKSAGIAARIQQDYRYKVATAVAFEGYKKEIAQLEDTELAKSLAKIAVQNFGDNPIRIYDGHRIDGHPAEAIKAAMSESTLVEKLTEILQAHVKK